MYTITITTETPAELSKILERLSAPQALVKPAEPAYTRNQLTKIGTALVKSGKAEQANLILIKYGVQTVAQLKPEQYDAFAAELISLQRG